MKFNIEVDMTPSEFKELTGFKNYSDVMEDAYQQAAEYNPMLKLTNQMTQEIYEKEISKR